MEHLKITKEGNDAHYPSRCTNLDENLKKHKANKLHNNLLEQRQNEIRMQ